jgi:hypothetical protein
LLLGNFMISEYEHIWKPAFLGVGQAVYDDRFSQKALLGMARSPDLYPCPPKWEKGFA